MAHAGKSSSTYCQGFQAAVSAVNVQRQEEKKGIARHEALETQGCVAGDFPLKNHRGAYDFGGYLLGVLTVSILLFGGLYLGSPFRKPQILCSW